MEYDIKECPFCAEEIKKDAIKCKHCGEFLKNDDILNATQDNQKEFKKKRVKNLSLIFILLASLMIVVGTFLMGYFYILFITIGIFIFVIGVLNFRINKKLFSIIYLIFGLFSFLFLFIKVYNFYGIDTPIYLNELVGIYLILSGSFILFSIGLYKLIKLLKILYKTKNFQDTIKNRSVLINSNTSSIKGKQLFFIRSNSYSLIWFFVLIIIGLGVTLPFHWVFYNGMKVFPKNNLTFSHTIITEVDVNDFINRYNNASFLEKTAMNNEPIVRKLMEKGIIIEKKDNEK